MSIADELSTLFDTKTAIKQAIINKGVDVPDDTIFADYANKINLISGGNESSDSFFEMRTLNNTNYAYLFSYYSGTTINLSSFNTSNVTNMKSMFYNCQQLTSLDLSNFNTSLVTDMNTMFTMCKNLTSLDLSNFNTSLVTDMSAMFSSCQQLTSLDLSNFNTSQVTQTYNMFYSCTSLTSLDIRNFDMSKVTSSGSMFYSCTSLYTLRLDNCNNKTIKAIIKSSGFPTTAISGETRKIYCKEANANGLTAPTNWVFEFIG